MIRLIIQFGISTLLLLFSTSVAWYEGSTILDKSLEWRYSTPFTQLLYGEVSEPSEISQLDYFVYAAKFQPTFPIIMVLSSLYLLILIGYYIFQEEKKGLAYYLSFLGGGLFILSYFTSNSPIVGGQIMFYLFLVCGVFCIVTALMNYYQILNRTRVKITS
ncbi:YjdJ family protein [Bacillus sp. ISL-75]|uniref:YjdJ family protein n=1 Tax=Bacillus sp. ISL-75 TaxID=2819137 RepID=UPI001BE65EDF|nr:YjdJ family protein [Bacillus sp. ISL-75]MBT2728809.1 YjdJ family protein [Bacillus sp. ISL-75]